MTTVRRNAIPNPAHTLIILNIDSFCQEMYDTVTQKWYTISCPQKSIAPACVPTIAGPPFTCTGDTVTYVAGDVLQGPRIRGRFQGLGDFFGAGDGYTGCDTGHSGFLRTFFLPRHRGKRRSGLLHDDLLFIPASPGERSLHGSDFGVQNPADKSSIAQAFGPVPENPHEQSSFFSTCHFAFRFSWGFPYAPRIFTGSEKHLSAGILFASLSKCTA